MLPSHTINQTSAWVTVKKFVKSATIYTPFFASCFPLRRIKFPRKPQSMCSLQNKINHVRVIFVLQGHHARPTTGSGAPACPCTPVAQRKMSCAPVVALASAVSSTTTRSCAAPANSRSSRRRRSSSRGPTDGPRGPHVRLHPLLPGPLHSLRQISTQKVNKVSTSERNLILRK